MQHTLHAPNLANPQYPFAAELEFCGRHCVSSPVIEVVDCRECKVPMELQRAARERAGRIRNANGKGN